MQVLSSFTSRSSAPCSPAPCSLPNPEKSWANGNPTIQTDEDVNRWLEENAPEAAREIKREERIVESQFLTQAQLGHGHRGHGDLGDNISDCLNIGTPVFERMTPPSHWAFILYPGCGSQEICDLLRPVLSPQRHQTLFMAFAEGREHKEIAEHFGCTRAAITLRLSGIRRALFKMLLEQTLPRPAAPSPETVSIDELLAEDAYRPSGKQHWEPGYKTKPPIIARVCNCGHHLRHRHLDHRRKEAGRERTLRCDYCHRVWTESEWPKLAA